MHAWGKTVFHVLRRGGSQPRWGAATSPRSFSTALVLHFHTRFDQLGHQHWCWQSHWGEEVAGSSTNHWAAFLENLSTLWSLQMWAGKCSACFPANTLSCVQANLSLDALVLTWSWVQETGERLLSSWRPAWTFSNSGVWVLCPLPSSLSLELSHFHTSFLFHCPWLWFKYRLMILTLYPLEKKVSPSNLGGTLQRASWKHCQRSNQVIGQPAGWDISPYDILGNCLTWLASIKLTVYYSIKNKEVIRQNLI